MSAMLLTSSIPFDVSGWWVSEKYDGVRAIWDGEKLLSRRGKDLNPPKWFIKNLPDYRLDGELFIGRGKFDELVSKIQIKGGDWSCVRFMVFDLAEYGEFEDRYKRLRSIPIPSHVQVVQHRQLGSNPEIYFSASHELDCIEAEIVVSGGEGCVIRRPKCLYRPGRIGDVIKIKRLVADIDRWQG